MQFAHQQVAIERDSVYPALHQVRSKARARLSSEHHAEGDGSKQIPAIQAHSVRCSKDHSAMTAVPTTRYVVFFAIALVGCAVDLGTKHWIFAKFDGFAVRTDWLWDEVFGFTTHLNEGALFGFGQGKVGVFVGL